MPLTRAGLIVRRAHIRPLDDQVDDEPTGLAIENVTSKYGLHSKVYNSPRLSEELKRRFDVSFEIHTNIQMDIHQKRMIDFAEWSTGEYTEAAQRLGLPEGAFMDELGWEAVVETYRGEILKHEASLKKSRRENRTAEKEVGLHHPAFALHVRRKEASLSITNTPTPPLPPLPGT